MKVFMKQFKECWPKGKLQKGSASKIVYFIHNLAEVVCVRQLHYKSYGKTKRIEWLFKLSGKIEYALREHIRKHRDRADAYTRRSL